MQNINFSTKLSTQNIAVCSNTTQFLGVTAGSNRLCKGPFSQSITMLSFCAIFAARICLSLSLTICHLQNTLDIVDFVDLCFKIHFKVVKGTKRATSTNCLEEFV